MSYIAGNSGSTLTGSNVDTAVFTIGSQTNKVLVAFVEWVTITGITVTDVRWNPAGVNEQLIQIGSTFVNGNRRIACYRLINPSAVTNGFVRATFSDTALASQAVHAAGYDGRDQTTPIPSGDIITGSGSSTTPSVTVPNVVSTDDVMDSVMDTGGGGHTIGANQTLIGSTEVPGDTHSSSRQLGSDGGVMSWTLGISGGWTQMGVRIVAAAAGPVAQVPRPMNVFRCWWDHVWKHAN